ncbi:MAG: hypothetical protein PHO10_07490 [Gemmiger sp.]|nr:hypothetical protein [Gemmiger sp.]
MERTRLSFLERLAVAACCPILSDLRFLPPTEQRQLVGLVRYTPLEAVPLAEWNDALSYLVGRPAAPSAAAARAALLQAMEKTANA